MFEIPRLTAGLFTELGAGRKQEHPPAHKRKAPNYSKFPAPWGPVSCARVVKRLWPADTLHFSSLFTR